MIYGFCTLLNEFLKNCKIWYSEISMGFGNLKLKFYLILYICVPLRKLLKLFQPIFLSIEWDNIFFVNWLRQNDIICICQSVIYKIYVWSNNKCSLLFHILMYLFLIFFKLVLITAYTFHIKHDLLIFWEIKTSKR